MKYKVKVSKKISWLSPYISVGLTYIPKNKKLSRVIAWSKYDSKRYGVGCLASIHQDSEDAPYRIWLHTRFSNGDRMSKIDLLTNLAHELAHMVDWKHTPKHKKLEAKISSAFMELLKKDGYISEEDELN